MKNKLYTNFTGYIFLFLCFFIPVSGQNDVIKQNPRIIFPSPEASALQKYVDIPVSNFHGIPSIDLPLYVIPIGSSLQLPVSVSYHGGGIKVAEEASRAGLGWALNAGGVISRTLKGFPDELTAGSDAFGDGLGKRRGYFKLNSNDKVLLEHLKTKGMDYNPYQYDTDFQKNNLSIQARIGLTSGFNGYLDTAQDIYNFNFCGFSGTFMMPDINSVVVQTNSPVKVVDMRFPYYFKMKDQDNNQYIFDALEYSLHTYNSYHFNPPGSPSKDTVRYVSSWYLSAIITPTQDTVKFVYQTMPMVKGMEHISFLSESIFRESLSNTIPQNLRGGTYTSYSTTTHIPLRLDYIYTKDIKVEIVSHPEVRKDILNDRSALDFIIVSNRNNRILKKYGFRQSYFKPVSDDSLFYRSHYRLRLDGIDEYSENEMETAIPLYNFVYNTSYLYSKNSSCDHWGFFNTGNSFVAPDDEDRSVDPTQSRLGMLTCIEYATGGKVTFEWESNTYSKYPDGSKVTDTDENLLIPKSNNKICGLKQKEHLTERISFNCSQSIKIRIGDYYKGLGEFMTREFFPDYYYNHTIGEISISDIPILKIYKISGDSKFLRECIFLNNKTIGINSEYVKVAVTSDEYEFVLENPRGGMSYGNDPMLLTMFADPRYVNTNPEYGYIAIEYISNPNPYRNYEKIAGGIRIKKIHSEYGNDTITKRYVYGWEPGLSSGILVQRPNHKYEKVYFYQESDGASGTGLHIDGVRMDGTDFNGLYSVSSGSTSIVEYKTIKETYSNSDRAEHVYGPEGESIEYHYSTIDDTHEYWDKDESRHGEAQPPSTLVKTSMSHWRGNLEKVYYRKGHGMGGMDKLIEYEYRIDEDFEDHFFSGEMFAFVDWTNALVHVNNNQIAYTDNGLNQFRLIPYSKKTRRVKETYSDHSYDLTKETEYVYPEAVFQQGQVDLFCHLPIMEKTTNSRGEEEIIYKSYVSRTNKLHIEAKTVDGYLVYARKFDYHPQTQCLKGTYSALIPAGGQSVPSGIQLSAESLSSGLSFIPEYRYEHDARNNLLEVYYRGEIETSYLWGYKGAHPIAEIQKKTASEIDNILSEIGVSRLVLSDCKDPYIYELERLQHITDTHVTLYKYHWMLGLCVAKGSNGISKYFDYDGFGRLQGVKNSNGMFEKMYLYHYRNQ